MTANKAKALFLDRDGTLIWDKDYLCDPAEVELIPGVVEALQAAREKGYRLYLFTNQSGVGRGYFTLDKVHLCNARMLELLGLGEDLFHAVCIADEAPDGPQVYRKPSPRFISEQIEADQLDPAHCYMIGDRPSDWLAGVNASIHSIALQTGKPFDEQVRACLAQHAVPVYCDLGEFVNKVLS